MTDLREASTGDSGEFDLNALESSRFGLELFGAGVLLFLCGMGLGLGSFTVDGRVSSGRIVDLVTEGLSLVGYILIVAGTWISAPRPHGPLPGFLRFFVVALYLAAIALQLVNWWGPEDTSDGFRRFAEIFWIATRLAPPAIAWLLWRYALRSGLTSNAAMWLGTAVVWTGVALSVEFLDLMWVGRFYMAVGVLVFFAAYLTARDLWMDAVVRGTRGMIARRTRRAS